MFSEATMNAEQTSVKFALDGVEIEATTKQMGELIGKLAALRRDMQPPVDSKPPPNIIPNENGSNVAVAPAKGSGVIIAIRDAGFGWVAVRLPADKATSRLVASVEEPNRKPMH